jgi:CheY-like chemotaxis protein
MKGGNLLLSPAVLVAADGIEAMELSRAFHGEIVLLLTDMDMPRMGGDQRSELIMNERVLEFFKFRAVRLRASSPGICQ